MRRVPYQRVLECVGRPGRRATLKHPTRYSRSESFVKLCVRHNTNLSDTAGDFTASIAWGDGTTIAGTVSGGNGSFTVTGGHTYADEGCDPLGVTITDTQNSSMITASGTVAVGEGDTLTAQPVTFAARANTPFNGTVASFSDSTYPDNIAGDFSVSINWGDGTTTAGTVGGGSGNPFTVSGTHTYTTAGTDAVVVTPER